MTILSCRTYSIQLSEPSPLRTFILLSSIIFKVRHQVRYQKAYDEDLVPWDMCYIPGTPNSVGYGMPFLRLTQTSSSNSSNKILPCSGGDTSRNISILQISTVFDKAIPLTTYPSLFTHLSHPPVGTIMASPVLGDRPPTLISNVIHYVPPSLSFYVVQSKAKKKKKYMKPPTNSHTIVLSLLPRPKPKPRHP